MKKLVIVGKGRGWEDAAFTTGERLGITQVNLRLHVDRVIDMNNYSLWGEKEAEDARNSRTMAEYQGAPYIDLDNYPLMDIISYFKTDYFTNTVDYAIALAVYEGYSSLELYGINMEVDSEYFWEKPGVEFWVGQAMGRGVNVTAHGNHTSILKSRDGLLYGYGIKRGELI